jgi:diaminohydroxyphosphoribosylaminopyrimidine deaminase/5-amino-6-(5-phosphoribosylamino)uracil reductase
MNATMYEKYMRQCLQLAQQGFGHVAPNPMVGCVIVYEGKIIGEGFHHEFGKAHAEVEAISMVKNQALLENSVLYVNLEPCAHHGKTPPCVDLIIEKKIPKVVIGSEDPFSEVSGKGIEKLKAAGVRVVKNILHDECRFLNRRFFTFHEKKRPYIILKWAQTKDGYIDRVREGVKGINWITGEDAQRLVHVWRAQESAILVGKNTVINDNPSLTVRNVKGKNPLRIILDSLASLENTYKVFDKNANTIMYNTVGSEKVHEQYERVKLSENMSTLDEILYDLHSRNIQSVIVEGGAFTLQAFINLGYWDEARVFTGDVLFEKGLKAPHLINVGKEVKVDREMGLTIYHAKSADQEVRLGNSEIGK